MNGPKEHDFERYSAINDILRREHLALHDVTDALVIYLIFNFHCDISSTFYIIFVNSVVEDFLIQYSHYLEEQLNIFLTDMGPIS